MYVESKTKRIFAIASLGKKFAFDTEICDYFEYLISKIEKFYRVKELFSVAQLIVIDSTIQLDCNKPAVFALGSILQKVVV